MEEQHVNEEKKQEFRATEHGKKHDAFGHHWHLYLAAFSVNICTVNIGCMTGWTSPAEKFLVIDGVYPGPIDEDTWSWIAAVFALGAMCGPIPLGLLTDKFGRKPCMLGIGVISLISWMLIATANGAAMILIARILGGTALAAHFTMLSIYSGEIATDDMRSTFGALMWLSVIFGFLFSVSVGPYVPPQVMACICGAVPVVFLATFVFMPESPYVLVGKGDLKGARKSLGWLRGNSSAQVEKELLVIQEALQEASAQRSPFSEKVRNLLGKKGNLKGFIISSGLLMFTELSGITPISFYAESIFRTSESSLDPAKAAIFIGAAQIIVASVTLVLTRFFSMKTLLIISSAGMAVGHALLGYYFYRKADGGDLSSLGLLPVVASLVYVSFFCIGFSALPLAVTSEVFENDVKATASSLGTVLGNLVSFFLAWKFSTLLEVLTPAGTFWTFGMNCVLACAFVIFLVPNTRGKSLQEIRDELNGRVRQNKIVDRC